MDSNIKMSKVDYIPPSYIAGQVAKMNGRKLTEKEEIAYSYADRMHNETEMIAGAFLVLSSIISELTIVPVSWILNFGVGKIRDASINTQMDSIIDDYEKETGKKNK